MSKSYFLHSFPSLSLSFFPNFLCFSFFILITEDTRKVGLVFATDHRDSRCRYFFLPSSFFFHVIGFTYSAFIWATRKESRSNSRSDIRKGRGWGMKRMNRGRRGRRGRRRGKRRRTLINKGIDFEDLIKWWFGCFDCWCQCFTHTLLFFYLFLQLFNNPE